jgi:hypothetical protein
MSLYHPDLRERETVLNSYTASIYRSMPRKVAGMGARLWLTNQRLIMKTGLLSQQITLPLYRIVKVWEGELLAGFSGSWMSGARHLCLEFDNGRQEFMIVENQAQFIAALNAARAQAPQVPDEVLPPIHAPRETIPSPSPIMAPTGTIPPPPPIVAQGGTKPLPKYVWVVTGCVLFFLLFVLGSLACGGILEYVIRMAGQR